MALCSLPKVGIIHIRGPISCSRAKQLGHVIAGQDRPGDRPFICAALQHPYRSPELHTHPLKDGPDNCSNIVTVMFKGKPRAGNSREIPVSRETGEKSLSLGKSRVTGISRGSGNSRVTGNSRILEAITFLSGIQITI